MPKLHTRLGSLILDNPIVISSGHVSRTWENIHHADRSGAGAIVIKSSFLEEEYRKVVEPYKPGYFPDTRPKFVRGADGLIGVCGLSHVPLEKWCEWIEEGKKNVSIPVIGSVMALSLEGYIKGVKLLEDAGAGAIEVSLGCPLPYLQPHPYTGLSIALNAEKVKELCNALTAEKIRKPLGVKIFFNILDPRPVEEVVKSKVDFITLASVGAGMPGIDLEKIEPDIFTAIALWGSQAAKHANFFSLLNMAKHFAKIHISASGGCQNWKDAIEYIMYGASSVQLQTILIREGFSIIEEIKKSMLEYMKRKGFETIEEMRGCIIPRLLSFEDCISAYGQTEGKIIASVNVDKCTGCGLCYETCFSYAIEMVGGKPIIKTDKCTGCQTCVVNCPEEAIFLQNVELIRLYAGKP